MATKEKQQTLGTKEAASKIGCKPAALRRYLRSKGKNTEGEYTRYSWKPDFDFSKLKADFAKHAEATKKEKPKTKAKANAKAKAKKVSKKQEVGELQDVA